MYHVAQPLRTNPEGVPRVSMLHVMVDLLLPEAENADSSEVIYWCGRIRASGETNGSWCTLRTSVAPLSFTYGRTAGPRSISFTPLHH